MLATKAKEILLALLLGMKLAKVKEELPCSMQSKEANNNGIKGTSPAWQPGSLAVIFTALSPQSAQQCKNLHAR